MNIAVVSINHNETPIEIREKFTFTESLKIDAGDYLLDRSVKELVIIATCNRSEIYVSSKDIEQSIEDVISLFKDFFQVENTEDYLLIKKDQEAVEHLFMVASGLDSAVLGEDQIIGQVKDAMQTAMELGFSKKILNRLFMEALNVGKKVRTEIKISEVPLSTSYIGINLVKRKLDSLEGKKALVIGAGEISKLSITYLDEENLDELYVTNRTHNRIKKIFKDRDDLIPVEYDDRYDVLSKVDVLVTATGAPHTIIEKDKIKNLNKELCILDLALPRDVEASVEDLDNITIFHLDDLNKMSEENLEKRKKLSEEAMVIIEKDVKEYLEWVENTKVDPVLQSLHSRCKQIRDDRMDYIDRKLDIGARERKVINTMIDSALRELIREPIKTLKSIENEDMGNYIKAMNDLFGFEE